MPSRSLSSSKGSIHSKSVEAFLPHITQLDQMGKYHESNAPYTQSTKATRGQFEQADERFLSTHNNLLDMEPTVSSYI